MGSWWNIKIGKTDAPIWGKNYVSDQLMLLFQDNDRVVGNDSSMVYAAPAGVLQDRLKLQGLSAEWVRSLAVQLFNEEDGDHDPRNDWPEGWKAFPTATSIVDAMVSLRGIAAAGGIPPQREQFIDLFLRDRWEYLKDCYDDPRFTLSFTLLETCASTIVELDLSGLIAGGWMAPDDHPHREARIRLAESVAASGPVIVITEGASDARWLQRSLEIAAPSVAHQFKFLDFDTYRAPGGTDRVVALTKGMLGVDVMNRIVVVLDNDTAGRQAAQRLISLGLPGRVVVINLPAVQYASHYPVLGPEGTAMTDVNGLAASVEFMFGEDVLTHVDGEFYPVRWHSFIEPANAYQGRLSDANKREVGQRIDRALSPASGKPIDDQIVEGCGRLSKMLIDAASPHTHLPASDRSVLSSWWRHDDLREARITFDSDIN